ncbi:hypothetical protein HanIR_Chr17g0875181 [Helianthus annuus]|nr:hypothetical protein HanIR_Chr17g0875181 [Helianthus annuus]
MICVIKRTCSVCRRREKGGPNLCDQKDRKTLVVLCESIKEKKENLSDSSICVKSLKRKEKKRNLCDLKTTVVVNGGRWICVIGKKFCVGGVWRIRTCVVQRFE